MTKRFFALFLATVMLCASLSACRGGSNPTNTPAGNEVASSGAVDTAAAPSGAPDTTPIVVGIAQDLDSSLDPYSITAAGTREVLFNVFEGLVKPDSTGAIVPAVAESYEVSEDGLTYTFTLRDEVKFHNGKVMTDEDILYSFKTCAETTVDAALASALSDIEVSCEEGKVIVKVPVKSTDFICSLAYVYIVPCDYTEQATKPVGTGPFKFVSRSVQENVILEKHADYYGEGAKVDGVTYRVYEDVNAMMSAIDAKAIDICAHLSIDQTAGLDTGHYKVLEGTMNLVQALYLNNAVKPFDDERVRQALCYAIDVEGILALTADGHGTPVGSAMYPNFTKYFDSSLANAYPHDVEKAKALLKEAGYENGISFSITVPSNYTPHVLTAEVVVEQLKEAGINANINLVEWSTWLSDVYKARNYETTICGFDASTLTASAMLARYCSNHGKNMFNYNNPEFDAVYAQAAAATDDAEATRLYKQCLEILSATAANAYIQDLAEFTVMNAALDGFEFYPLYVMDMSTVYRK